MALKFLQSKLPIELTEKAWKNHKSFFQSKTGISSSLRKTEKQYDKVIKYARENFFELKSSLEELVELIDETRILIHSRYKNITDSRFNLTPKKTRKFMKAMADASEDLHQNSIEELERIDKILGTAFYELGNQKKINAAFKAWCSDQKKMKMLKLYRILEKKLPTMNAIDFRMFYENFLAKGKPYRKLIPDFIHEFDENAKKESWGKMPYLKVLKSLDDHFKSNLFPKFLKMAGAYI